MQPDWWHRIVKIAEQHDDIECELMGRAKREMANIVDRDRRHVLVAKG